VSRAQLRVRLQPTKSHPSPESSDNGGTDRDDDGQSGKSEDSGDGEDGNGKNKSKGKKGGISGPKQVICIP
jgi:hypothetical protein